MPYIFVKVVSKFIILLCVAVYCGSGDEGLAGQGGRDAGQTDRGPRQILGVIQESAEGGE